MSEMTKVCPMCNAAYAGNQTFCSNDGATLRPMVEKKGDLTDTVVADRYRVLKKLGEGGMGQVYLAEHVRMKRKSALKVMRPDVGADPDAVARFTREATNALVKSAWRLSPKLVLELVGSADLAKAGLPGQSETICRQLS